MKKMEAFFSQGTICLGVFCDIFSACLSTFFNSDIRKENRRLHVKLHNILFFLKKKKNEMKRDENKTLC